MVDRREKDPFDVVGAVPKGKSYKWSCLTVYGETALGGYKSDRAAGWRVVPAKRHPKMPRDNRGRVVVGGMVLVERSEKATRESLKRDQDAARKMYAEHPAAFPDPAKGFRYISDPVIGRYPDPSEIRQEMEAAGGAFPVSIEIVLTEREMDAAAILHLTGAEYARRKVMMISELGHEGSVFALVEVSPGKFRFAENRLEVK